MSDWKLELSRELTLAQKLCTYTQYWVIKRSEEEEAMVKLLLNLGVNVHAQAKHRGTLAIEYDGRRVLLVYITIRLFALYVGWEADTACSRRMRPRSVI
jgi:hypothetical protein